MSKHSFTYRHIFILAVLFCLAWTQGSAMAAQVEEKLPVPAKTGLWVNDYAKVFSDSDRLRLEQKLRNYANRTSTQILVITLDDNGGYPASMLAPLIGERWEVGQKGKDNGLIILMDMQDRDVFISTGYGLEAYVPDAITKRIVENEVIPHFKQGDYYGGIDAATNVIIDLLEGNFTADDYRARTGGSSGGSGAGIGGIIFMIIIFSLIFGGRGRRSTGMGRSNLPLWIALGMLSGGRSHSGSWGSFSGGSGGFGGGGGGFGGFSGGGGSFGGGGAGGSW